MRFPNIRLREALTHHLPGRSDTAPLEGFSDRLDIYGMSGWEQRSSIQRAVDKLINSTREFSE